MGSALPIEFYRGFCAANRRFEMMTVNCVESMKGNTNDRCGGGEKQMEMKCLPVHLYMSSMQTEQNESFFSGYC